MNNWEKSNLELTPAPEITVIDENGMLSVLIKHDYYSSDTDHGRKILSAFLDSLAECGNTLSKIILIDSAVKLLDIDELAYRLEKLFGLSRYSYICEESLAFYEVEYTAHDNVVICSASDISMELMQTGNLITLE
jgi:hypothetical protein